MSDLAQYRSPAGLTEMAGSVTGTDGAVNHVIYLTFSGLYLEEMTAEQLAEFNRMLAEHVYYYAGGDPVTVTLNNLAYDLIEALQKLEGAPHINS